MKQLVLAGICIALLYTHRGAAQVPSRDQQPLPTSAQPLPEPASETVDSLKMLKQRVERLQTVLDKVTFGPQSYYFTRLRSWFIPLADALNDSISQYFFEVMDNDSSFIESRGDIQVIATSEPSRDLVAIFFTGNSKEAKGQRLRETLMKKPERRMYQTILESREYSEDKELIDRKFRIADLSAPRLMKNSDSVLVSFDRYSLTTVDHREATVMTIRAFDNIRVRFGHLWGAEVKLGNEEYGLPFWTSGNLSFMALYNQIKVGAHIPFKFGLERNTPSTLTAIWKPRNLNGTYGVSGEFDWAFAGAAFLVGFPRTDTDGTFADTNRIYTIKTSAHLWYSFTVGINNQANLIRFKMGLGFQQIAQDRLVRGTATTPSQIVPVEGARFFWSPYLKAEYMNQQFARRFGATFQYFRDWGLGSLWMEIIPEQLRVEAKFAASVVRPRDPWEPPYFFTIAVPYTFSL